VLEREEQRKVSDDALGKLEAVLLGMNDAVLVVDGVGQPVLANRAYHQMFGEGTASLPLVDERGQRMPEAALPRYRAARGEKFTATFALSPDSAGDSASSGDDSRWFEANGQPIVVNGVAQGGVVVIRDITDRSMRRLQTEFVAMASHELRTPLGIAQATLQKLLQSLHDRAEAAATTTKKAATSAKELEDVESKVEVALRQIRRMNTLVVDLVDVGRLQTGKLNLQFQAVNLNEIVKQSVEAMQNIAADHNIELVVPDQILLVQGDTVRLEQIVFNLLMNAVFYAPDSPRIDARLRQESDTNTVELQVQDYGVGIPSEKFAHIFTAFYQIEPPQLRERGLGLGLFIASELVKAHGGTISVSSQVEVGTTFTVTLPRLRVG
jgi:two-component system CheB/CheR fusion protein